MTKAELLDILGSEARIRTKNEAERYVGGNRNLQLLRNAGWIQPWKKVYHELQFDVRDLDAAIDRVKTDGWPLPSDAH